MAQPFGFNVSSFLRTWPYEPTKGRVNVGADETVAAISRGVFLAEAGDPAFCQTNTNIDLAATNGRDHVSRSGGEGNQGGIQAEVLLGKIEGRGEVLRHVANSER